MSDLTTGRIPATPVDLQQPLSAVETDRPVANRETPRETSGAVLPYRIKWPTSEYGTCDGCAGQRPLAWAYDVDGHNEPWLCGACAKEQP